LALNGRADTFAASLAETGKSRPMGRESGDVGLEETDGKQDQHPTRQ
jgi:hypothetical protein